VSTGLSGAQNKVSCMDKPMSDCKKKQKQRACRKRRIPK
jgi:hypothetical protein